MATKPQHKFIFDTAKIKFADSVIPTINKFSGKRHIKFGSKDDYPKYLTYLYNKSAIHAAIVNGKAVYIVGNGLAPEDENNLVATEFLKKANENESWDEVIKKAVIDIEKYGGFYLQCVPKLGGGFNYYNLTYINCRSNIEGSEFGYRKENVYGTYEDWKYYPSFNTTNKEASIFFYKENNGSVCYPLPSWVACANWIESDIEVSKATLTKALTGFSATKMITFVGVQPTEEEKGIVTQRIKNKFNGSEGETTLINFAVDKEQAPLVDDLGTNDLTKEDFTAIDNLITSKVFAGHSVTHPLLFGIQQAGKLGNSSELKIAFDIFKNTYANSKQRTIEKLVSYFASIAGVQSKFKLKDIEPVGVEIDAATMLAVAPKEWITDKLGIDKSYFEVNQSQGAKQVINALNSLSPLVANKVLESMAEDEIRSLVNLQPRSSVLDINGMPIVTPTATTPTAMTNDALVNLTGRQQQGLLRILRLFNQGKLNKAQSAIQLKGFGFTDDDINNYLGVDDNPATIDTKFSSDDDLSAMFEACFELASDYEVIKKTPISQDENFEFRLMFDAQTELDENENKVKDLLQLDPNLTAENVATTLGLDAALVTSIIAGLIAKGIIEQAASGAIKVVIKTPKVSLPKILIRYSYEKRNDVSGPDLLPTSRPFCKKLVGMSKQGKMWSRVAIQNISQAVGYNVFEHSGGFFNNNGNIEYQCRHEWVANAVIKKTK